MFGYVPTGKELEHILYLRREIQSAEMALKQKRDELAEYHLKIEAPWQAELIRHREAA